MPLLDSLTHPKRASAVVMAVLAVAVPAATAAAVPTADEQIGQARSLELARDWAKAHAAWERVIDTCQATEAQREQARARLRYLNHRVPPNTDHAKANVWTAYAAICRTLDFTWKPKDSDEEKKVRIVTTDDEVEWLKQGFHSFAGLVFEYSRGQLRVDYEIEVIEEPLTRLSGDDSFWLGPWDVEELIAGRYQPGQVDSVFAYAKLSDGEDQKVPAAMFGGTFGGDYGPGGAGWTGIMWYPGWMKGDGEVELHEWLHQVDWAFAQRLRYPNELVPSSDEGRMEGDEGGDPEYRRQPGEPTWMRFYHHIMTEHITSRMWQEARCRPWEGVTYARDWLVLGPFPYEGDVEPALKQRYLDSEPVRPTAGEPMAGRTWKPLASDADFVDLDAAFGGADNAVAYAYAVIRSDRPQQVHLWLGYDDSIIAWVNGNRVYRFAGPQAPIQDQVAVPVRLREGDNHVLLKVLEIGGGWGFYARLGDEIGRAIEGVEWALP